MRPQIHNYFDLGISFSTYPLEMEVIGKQEFCSTVHPSLSINSTSPPILTTPAPYVIPLHSEENELEDESSARTSRVTTTFVENKGYKELQDIPETSFSCEGKKPGYYADEDVACKVCFNCFL